jgi:hypothetical protein
VDGTLNAGLAVVKKSCQNSLFTRESAEPVAYIAVANFTSKFFYKLTNNIKMSHHTTFV